MAQEVLSGGNAEMWLPSELLGDDFFLEEKKYRRRMVEDSHSYSSSSLAAPFCFPYDCDSSSLSSPLESEESDEEDHPHSSNGGVVSGLSQQMARSLLLDRRSPSLPPPPHAAPEGSSSCCLGCSPQSPLCSDGMWSGWSAKGGVRVPPSPEPLPDNAWDLLYAAAGQVRRLSPSDDLKRAGGCALLRHGPPRKVSPPRKEAAGYYCFDGARQQQHHALALSQLQQLKQQQQLLKQQQQLSAFLSRQNRIRASVGLGSPSVGGFHPPVLSRSTWPPPLPAQQPPPPPSLPCGGSGMRAVFLGGSGARKQSSGTGVFLPRRVGSPAEPRKKPACSTVLVPAKVVQALNLNLEDMGAHPHPRYPGGAFFVDPDTCSGRSSGGAGLMMNQKRAATPPSPPVKPQLAEMRLPPEWTY